MAPIQRSHPRFHGQKAGHIDVRVAQRGAKWAQDPTSEPWRGYLPRQSAIQELFRRWPSVPSRELERIRRVLLHCDELAHPAATHRLSEPARALLDLVTGELERRREGNHQPSSNTPVGGLSKPSPARRHGELL
ncbi:hypothetical protein [Arthrobacter sp. MA-N2]|uniref:hypothetical protein n=1 Tax=Arthrobacter sp. MA-N2 TaxID=1101188 RepID=UPI0005525620|nr:hypothetical protein [Arthrobacter sp. MA-N2]